MCHLVLGLNPFVLRASTPILLPLTAGTNLPNDRLKYTLSQWELGADVSSKLHLAPWKMFGAPINPSANAVLLLPMRKGPWMSRVPCPAVNISMSSPLPSYHTRPSGKKKIQGIV